MQGLQKKERLRRSQMTLGTAATCSACCKYSCPSDQTRERSPQDRLPTVEGKWNQEGSLRHRLILQPTHFMG